MFFVLSKILDVLLAPLTWALLSIGGAGLAVWKDHRRLAAGFLGAAALILYLFSVEPVSNALVRGVEGSGATTLREGVTYDAVVVLGGLVDVDATAASGLRSYDQNVERLLVAWDLVRSRRARAVVVSGGTPDVEDHGGVVEARVLADQLIDWGVPITSIVVEDRALNTRENAIYVSDIVRTRGWKDVVVVTSAAHMKRSLECFAATGLVVDALAVDYRGYDRRLRSGSWLPRAMALEQSTAALREWFGRMIYRARGYATPDTP